MKRIPEWARTARAKWRYTGKERPAFARTPRLGERSVWDFPRPPAIEPVAQEVSVRAGDLTIARSQQCLRVLETGGPPTYYLPAADLALDLLRPSGARSRCEWKGEARYWSLDRDGSQLENAAWSYPAPFPEFERLRDHFSFYPALVECRVGSIRALPQPGGFYGGWVTPELVGPFKGEPGSESL
jgi:uncharacterized protein (DUF427 family)